MQSNFSAQARPTLKPHIARVFSQGNPPCTSSSHWLVSSFFSAAGIGRKPPPPFPLPLFVWQGSQPRPRPLPPFPFRNLPRPFTPAFARTRRKRKKGLSVLSRHWSPPAEKAAGGFCVGGWGGHDRGGWGQICVAQWGGQGNGGTFHCLNYVNWIELSFPSSA